MEYGLLLNKKETTFFLQMFGGESCSVGFGQVYQHKNLLLFRPNKMLRNASSPFSFAIVNLMFLLKLLM